MMLSEAIGRLTIVVASILILGVLLSISVITILSGNLLFDLLMVIAWLLIAYVGAVMWESVGE